MNVAIYARVSTEAQEARGTIASQIEAVRLAAAAAGDEITVEFIDDGYSGARLDRPGLDGLRDGAEAGAFGKVWCLTPDRLSRSYAYQVLVTDELARHGVVVSYVDTPALDSDPQARLLTQIQSVIAEYERAKISERSRRGKLFRARAGEAVHRRVPFGYIRVPRSGDRMAHLVINEAQAQVVRRLFADYTTGGLSLSRIADALNAEGVPSPGGTRWLTSTISRLLKRPVYVGRAIVNTTQVVHDRGPGAKPREIPRPAEEWITIACPPIIDEATFAAAGRACAENTNFSSRRLDPDEELWLLRGLVFCACGIRSIIKRSQSLRAVTQQHYYLCRDRAHIASREPMGCREPAVRADVLDDFVFGQLKEALCSPDLLLAGEAALARRAPAPDDDLLGAELARLSRRIDGTGAERRRLADMYQAGVVDAAELSRRATEIDRRSQDLTQTRDDLIARRRELATDNQLRRRVGDFAGRVAASMNELDFAQRQRLVRLLVERVQVTGWQVDIQLRIPLDGRDDQPPAGGGRDPSPGPGPGSRVSSEDRLRSVGHRPGIGQLGGPGQVVGLQLHPVPAEVAVGVQAGGGDPPVMNEDHLPVVPVGHPGPGDGRVGPVIRPGDDPVAGPGPVAVGQGHGEVVVHPAGVDQGIPEPARQPGGGLVGIGQDECGQPPGGIGQGGFEHGGFHLLDAAPDDPGAQL
ncbi:MAG: recombinase family protein, partial [Acidimicrobiales bacterium]